jgi:hypothetical protein
MDRTAPPYKSLLMGSVWITRDLQLLNRNRRPRVTVLRLKRDQELPSGGQRPFEMTGYFGFGPHAHDAIDLPPFAQDEQSGYALNAEARRS